MCHILLTELPKKKKKAVCLFPSLIKIINHTKYETMTDSFTTTCTTTNNNQIFCGLPCCSPTQKQLEQLTQKILVPYYKSDTIGVTHKQNINFVVSALNF